MRSRATRSWGSSSSGRRLQGLPADAPTAPANAAAGSAPELSAAAQVDAGRASATRPRHRRTLRRARRPNRARQRTRQRASRRRPRRRPARRGPSRRPGASAPRRRTTDRRRRAARGGRRRSPRPRRRPGRRARDVVGDDQDAEGREVAGDRARRRRHRAPGRSRAASCRRGGLAAASNATVSGVVVRHRTQRREDRRRVGWIAEHRHVADARPREREHQRVPRRVVAGPRHDLHLRAGRHRRERDLARSTGGTRRIALPPAEAAHHHDHPASLPVAGTRDPGIEQRPGDLPVTMSAPQVGARRHSPPSSVPDPPGPEESSPPLPPLPLPLLPPLSSLSSSPPPPESLVGLGVRLPP